MVGAMSYALLLALPRPGSRKQPANLVCQSAEPVRVVHFARQHDQLVGQSALLVIAVAAVGMSVGALPHIAAGRPAGVTGICARIVAVACVAFIFRPLVSEAFVDAALGARVRRSWCCLSSSAGWSTRSSRR